MINKSFYFIVFSIDYYNQNLKVINKSDTL